MGCCCRSRCRQCGTWLLLPLLVLAQLAAAANTPKAAEVDERLIGTRPAAAASLLCLASSSHCRLCCCPRLAGGNVCEGAAADRQSRRPVGDEGDFMGSTYNALQVGACKEVTEQAPGTPVHTLSAEPADKQAACITVRLVQALPLRGGV